MRDAEIKRISLEKAVELLREDGIEVNIHQAEAILDFMYEIVEIVVDQYLSQPA
ncbi:MAG: hypothetical protein ACTHJ5_09505 [Ilyomonas sp.]